MGFRPNLRKIRIKDIFLDHWWNFYIKNYNRIRFPIIANVVKMLACRTGFLGFHEYICLECSKTNKAPHTCKSRFCSSCGKKATDNWIKTALNTLPHTTWQHIIFTMPDVLWVLFWLNRPLMGKIPAIAANIVITLAKKKDYLPGIFLAIHTFGRQLTRNYHIHLSTTFGGLSLSLKKWKKNGFLWHETVKKRWKDEIIHLFREEYKDGNLVLPPHLSHIKTYDDFRNWIAPLDEVKWVVQLEETTENIKQCIDYLGKYLKRPPIGETRIINYDGESVTFEYLDHNTDKNKIMALPATEFIARLICHIPDTNFRIIRYFGLLAYRVRGELVPLAFKLLKIRNTLKTKVYIPWREMIKKTYKYDPLKCSCGAIMQLFKRAPPRKSLVHFHKEIALGLI